MKVAAIIVSAGSGRRFGSDKAVIKFAGKPLFYHSCRLFLSISKVKQVILVLQKKHFVLAKKMFADRLTIVAGGPQRRDSVRNGLKALNKDITHVLVHDAARLLIRAKLVKQIIKELKNHSAVICGISPADTIKLVNQGVVQGTVNRDNLVAVQTPQGFERKLLHDAYAFAQQPSLFDEAEAVEIFGQSVKVIAGDRENIKITYPKDLIIAQALYKNLR